MRYTFIRAERLKSAKRIGALFQLRQSVGEFPFRLFWMEVEDEQAVPLQMAFSVPRKKFKRATDRNRIRRRMREAYRLHKMPILSALQQQNRRLACLLLYAAAQDMPDWNDWTKKMVRILGRLLQQLPPIPTKTTE